MPNQVESYQKVIEIIADVNFEHNAPAMLLQIAKTSPQTVVDAVMHLKQGCSGNNGQQYGVSDAVMNALHASRKIEAIKQHRLDTGLGLKDAKDAVDNVIAKHLHLRELFHNRRSY